MPVTVYKSTDASAPVIKADSAGLLYAMLKACLVTGYGAKAAAGWTEDYSGTNKGVLRAPSGKRHYFRIDDSNPVALASNREGYVRGYESMSAVDTGTGPFPTTTQATTGGNVLRKSATIDTTTRPWVVVADARTCYAFIKSGDYGPGYASIGFGEFYSLGGANDLYNSFVAGGIVRQGTATGEVVIPNPANEGLEDLTAMTAVTTGHYAPRSFVAQDIQSAVTFGKHGDAANSAAVLAGLLEYPNRADQGMHLAQVWVHEVVGPNAIRRGRMRGFWHFLHPIDSPVRDGDTWAGTGALTGKTFMCIRPTAVGTGVFVLETSDTWETN